MSETARRLLSLLGALQARPMWTGGELADRAGVSHRTVRRDIERLRAMGYPVESEAGPAGGYRLGYGGAAVPPLMLDEEEAVALAVCVRAAGGDSVRGVGESANRALLKLEHLLPARARPTLAALSATTVKLPSGPGPVDPDLLVVLARACREETELALVYRDAGGRTTERTVEPYRVVSAGRRWYLVARDRLKQEWRTLRTDRVISAAPTGHRFTLRDPPDAAALVQRAITTAPYRYQATLELGLPLAEAAMRVPATVGILEAIDPKTTLLTTGADDLSYLAMHVVGLGCPFRVLGPPALHDHIRELAERLLAACSLPAP